MNITDEIEAVTMTLRQMREIDATHPATVIRVGDFSLTLDTPCYDCGGTGQGEARLGLERYGCHHCNGKGRILSSDGKALVDFMRRWA